MSSTSRRLSASSYVPISSSGPATRSEAIGTLGRDRPDKAIIEPRGVLPMRMPIASSASVDSSASTPSRTITDGAVRDESSALSLGATASQIVSFGRSNASKTLAPSGSIRSRAAVTCFRKTNGSLSRSSTVTHANGRASRSAHCARSVVLPYPAGAATRTTGNAPAARSLLTSAVLETF